MHFLLSKQMYGVMMTEIDFLKGLPTTTNSTATNKLKFQKFYLAIYSLFLSCFVLFC